MKHKIIFKLGKLTILTQVRRYTSLRVIKFKVWPNACFSIIVDFRGIMVNSPIYTTLYVQYSSIIDTGKCLVDGLPLIST